MNRAFALIFVPALLVAIGYVFVFRYMRVSPAYWRLIIPAVLLTGALWWLERRTARKSSPGAQ